MLGKIVAVTKTDKPNKHNFLKRKIGEIEKSIKTEPPVSEHSELSLLLCIYYLIQATLADVTNQSKLLSEEIKSLRSSVFQEVKDLHSLVSQEVKDLRSSVSQEVKDLCSSVSQLLATVSNINEKQGGGTEGIGGLRAGGLQEEVKQQK